MEVNRQYDISADILRYYERIGLLPRMGRTSDGVRSYPEDDCHRMEYIKCIRNAGVPVETLLGYVTLFHQGASAIQAGKSPLLEQREQIAARINELNQVPARLDWKLDSYEG